jgi:hypothetical protein
MIIFEQMEHIPKARLPSHLEAYLTRLFAGIISTNPLYDPQNDGQIILLEPSDNDISVSEIVGARWRDSCFEGASMSTEYHCFHMVILRNNQYCISVIAPDEPWLDADIRTRILRELE